MYCDFVERTERLTDTQFRELFNAICHYAQFRVEPTMSDRAADYFQMFKPTLDGDYQRYLAQCETNARIAAEREEKKRTNRNELHEP